MPRNLNYEKRVHDPAAGTTEYNTLGVKLKNKNEIAAGKLLRRKIQAAGT
jgi:hypothetical protein